MKDSPSSTTSPMITAPERQLSEREDDALAQIDASLSCGASLLRPMVKRMIAEGLDASHLYQLSVEGRRAVMTQSGLTPLNAPTWDELVS